ncbi:hypothetical protein F5B22DRAFT_614882 [Xylaria bambusicola]|uniref:uncharacterized protein n=1 Tax=Xylaria bambusicola TaxID=326684 RepID=UPI0020079664|nr:uncharacterized protein F5B22DRAFT_614882 [Xylaria bambusicola]KAI0512697.1 hypothetical protein F5B22DRAFT_614882 [Xylaria bambusicola]
MPKQYNLDEEPFLEKGERGDSEETLTWMGGSEASTIIPRNINPHWIWLAHAVLLSLSALLFSLSFCSRTAKISDLEYTQKYSAWSPAASAVKYETQHFDLPPKAEGPFIGKGDDVDARWDYISAVGDTMISHEEMISLGLDPETSLKITDPRNGKPGYRVAIEMFHQLHCLNLLRQNAYKEYYAPLGGDISAPPTKLRNHLDHCIDALRQFVICQGDIGVFSFNFPLNDGDPWPNYSTPHTCRNFESIRQWAVDHTVPRGPDEPEH